jgi:hypothetical protein
MPFTVDQVDPLVHIADGDLNQIKSKPLPVGQEYMSTVLMERISLTESTLDASKLTSANYYW